MMEYQTCYICHKSKPLTEEYFDRYGIYGTWAVGCKQCSEELLAYYERFGHSPIEHREIDPHREKHRVKGQNNRAINANLPALLTESEWLETINHFHGVCAICHRQCYDLFDTISMHLDHWIPITDPDCPGTVAWNAVPMCSICNKSKGGLRPLDWLNRRYSKKKANQIYNEITEYLETRRGNE